MSMIICIQNMDYTEQNSESIIRIPYMPIIDQFDFRSYSGVDFSKFTKWGKSTCIQFIWIESHFFELLMEFFHCILELNGFHSFVDQIFSQTHGQFSFIISGLSYLVLDFHVQERPF